MAKSGMAKSDSMAKDIEDELAYLRATLGTLSGTLEAQGQNVAGTKDVFGRKFAVPVDDEHKATQDPLLVTLFSCAKPHMAAFHSSWFGFFASFYSTFAAASLGAYIIPDLNLSNSEWTSSGTAAVGGTIFFRLAMGWICEKFGARRGLGLLLIGTTPAILLMMFVTEAWQFIVLRCIIGFSLATFVACQTWCSQMFSKKVVGGANATAAGWGNLGGGITNLTMPFIFLGFMSATGDTSLSWRLSYIVPLALHLIAGVFVLTSRDLPDGNYGELELSGAKTKTRSDVVLKVGFSNINAWILTITYGMCFGIELTMNNVAARYFYAYQGLTPQIAGIAAACWGLMNLFARSMGGFLSDWANSRYGLRGRLWAAWIVQTLEGLLAVALGLVTINMDAPDTDKSAIKVNAWTFINADPIREVLNLPTGWVSLAEECGHLVNTTVDFTASLCNTISVATDEALRECLHVDSENILKQTPPLAHGGPDLNCISNSNTIGQVMIIVIVFSLCVQAAEGLHYGIVPYVSRTALGIVSGMVGAGGNTGAVIAGFSFFQGQYRTDQGFIYMGIMVMCLTGLLFFVYFPDQGGMLFKAGALGKYDPQIIKPPAGYEGADSMNFEEAERRKAAITTTEAKTASAENSVVTVEHA